MNKSKRLYVLDTNVLMHDPTAIFRFEEHDIYLPMVVLEELDAAKKGYSEVARNVRQVSRFISQLMDGDGDLRQGLALRVPEGTELRVGTGRLYFQTEPPPADDRGLANGSFADNQILRTIRHLREQHPQQQVVLVSKDINLRIKAAIHQLPAEDYANDRALDDLSLLYPGLAREADSFWQRYPEVESWTDQGRTWYRCQRQPGDQWYPNQCLTVGEGDGAMEAIIKQVDDEQFSFRLVDDHYASHHAVWGISARNREQNFALNLLLDPEVDFVTLMGTAGTGKTLLTLAAGLAQTMDQPIYKEIVMTRATVPVGEEIGFLPGTEEEKMTPWMGALTDNLEVLASPSDGSDWARAATNDLLTSRIKVRAMNFMRGRTFLGRFLILDEAQNLTSKQMKTLITRAGPGTKIVCLGNVEQIDTPYLTETTSGLTFVVDRFKNWQHSAHITLQRGERSRLADFASEVL
ncbi:MAG: PhoH family protein [Wenzhouxiangellaceae bacterium]